MTLRKNLFTTCLLFLGILLGNHAQAQADLCGGAPLIGINTTCTATAYNVQQTWGNEIAAPSCGASVRDGWYTFTTSATQNFVSITATTNQNLGIAIYTGVCGSLVEATCMNNNGTSGTEMLNMTVTPSTTYYIRLFRTNAGTGNMTGNICLMSPARTTSCSTTSLDNGGGSNYPANSNYMAVYCPATAGQCIRAAFTAFNTEAGYDFLSIHDGNSIMANDLGAGLYSGTTSPGTITATAANSSGCLTFWFTSDGSNQAAGWSANITCVPCAAASPSVPQDCFGGTTVCNDVAFSGNSSGSGNDVDLNATNQGCLSGEHQSSWYYFSPSASGTIALNITPSVLTDDYDFAIWGPLTGVTCPPATPPLRCSYSAVDGITGLNASAGTETSEGSSGDGFVATMNVVAGQKFVLLVDNYTGSTSPFTLDWTMSGGASLNCVVLPVQLVDFTATSTGNRVRLNWNTMSETNNQYFTIEKSVDGIHFYRLHTVQGAGTVNQPRSYESFDNDPSPGTNYYRLSQTDFDGNTVEFGVQQVDFSQDANSIALEVYPVPATDFINLLFTNDIESETQVYLMDITGRILLAQTLEAGSGHQSSLNLSGIRQGVYFVVAENKSLNKKSALRKIVVE